MRRTIIAAAAVAVAGAAGVAVADDQPKRVPERPALVAPAPALLAGAPFLPEPYPFGLHRDLAEDMAKELGLPADRVAEAMRKAIGAQFDRRRDEALECFDDREKCKAAGAGGPFLERPPMALPAPVRPGRSVRP